MLNSTEMKNFACHFQISTKDKIRVIFRQKMIIDGPFRSNWYLMLDSERKPKPGGIVKLLQFPI